MAIVGKCQGSTDGRHCDHWLNEDGVCCACGQTGGPGGQEECVYTCAPMSKKQYDGVKGSLDRTHGAGYSPSLYIAIERRLLATIYKMEDMLRDVLPMAEDDPDGTLEDEGRELLDRIQTAITTE